MSKEMLIWGMTGCSILIPDGKSPFADLSHSLPLMFFHASLVLLTVGEKRRGIADNIFFIFFFCFMQKQNENCMRVNVDILCEPLAPVLL